MVEFINFLGGVMYVDESKAAEYEALGYRRKPVESNNKPEEKIVEPVKVETKKTEANNTKVKVTRKKK